MTAPANRRGRIDRISGRGWVPAARKPKFSDVTVRDAKTGEVIRTEPAIRVTPSGRPKKPSK